MITSITQIRARYAETDQMGIVYHGNYFTWFEIARIQLLDELNISYKKLEKQNYLIPVLEANAQFKKPTYFDDLITVKTSIKTPPSVKFRVDYEILRNNELCTTGYTLHTFINKKGIPIRPPKEFIEKINAFFKKK